MRIAALFMGFILAGCKLGPEYETPKMDTPLAFSNTLEQHPYMEEEMCWWKHFNDPILVELVQKTIAHNYDIKTAITNIQASRANLTATVAELFPTVNAQGSITRNKGSTNAGGGTGGVGSGGLSGKPFTNYQTGFTAVWQIDLFGRVLSAIEAAEAGVDLSTDEARGLTITLLADLASNYMNLRGFQRQLEATRKNYDLWDYVYKLNQDLAKAGLIATEVDVLQAKTNRDNAAANIPILESGIKAAMHHIAMLTGQNPTALYEMLSPHKPVPEIDDAIFAGLPSELIKRRPDIRAADDNFRVANAEVGVAVGNLFPSLNLTGNYGWSSRKASNLFTHNSNVYSYGGNFLWTLIDFGQLNALLDQAVAIRDGTFYNYKSTVLKAFEEVETTLTAYAKERDRLRSLKEALDASKEAAELSMIRYEAGRITFIQTLQTQIAYQQNIVAYNQSLVARSNNAIAVYKALGGGWQPSDEEIIEQSEKTPEVVN